MLATTTYPPEYLAACRDRVAATCDSWARAAASGDGAATALERLEPLYFGHALLALDASFVHRLRAAEGKDGNPLNEVRLLCAALLSADGMLRPEKGIKYDPARAVLGLAVGAPVRLGAAAYARLAAAFLAEVERRYVPPAAGPV